MRKRSTKAAEGRPQRGLHPGMPITRHLSRSHLEIALAFLAGYVALDWLSYVHPIASLAITPWSPQPGLSFALILLFGRQFIPWLFVAPFIADVVVRHAPLPLWAELTAALIIGVGYAAGTGILTSRLVRFDVTLSSTRDLLWLIAVAATSSALVAVSYVALMVAIGLIEPVQFLQATVRYWIGDSIGVAVVTPFMLTLFTRRRLPVLSWEFLGPLALLLGALWLVVGVEAFRFQLFYLLFLPVIWTAVRFGLEGVTVGLAITQIGLMAAIHFSSQSAMDVTAFQALMMMLAVTGLAVGVIVSEQRRTQHQLRLHQEALARATRLGSMGEFAAVLAHEINQPLTAIANYTRLANEAAQAPSCNTAIVAEATAKATEQVDRAAEVVRRLREFIRVGRMEFTVVSLLRVIEQVGGLMRTDFEQHGIAMDLRVPRELPPVMGDSLQLEQVVANLLRNSVESIVEAGRYDGRVSITAQAEPDGVITTCIRDNGPGFDEALTEQMIAPFTTTKPEGLGLGLSLCRSIIEAHGGKLSVAGDATGAVVCFTLPTVRKTGAA